jgi:hypothetical protein
MTQQIPLYNRAQRKLYALVDDENFEGLTDYRWRLNSKGYAIRSYSLDGKEIIVALHREIMQPPPGLVVDHIDHDKLNNTRANLRIITQQQNLMNRRVFRNSATGFKGVTFQNGKWHTAAQKDGRTYHFGFHDELKTAALVYDCAATLLFGAEYAWRNLPEQPIPPEIEGLVRSYLERRGE